MTTTTTVYHLRAVIDELAARTHLGATEMKNRTFCGVSLLVKGDERFGGRYKDSSYSASTDLSAVDCRACQRGAAWKDRKGSTWAAPAPKTASTDAGQAGR